MFNLANYAMLYGSFLLLAGCGGGGGGGGGAFLFQTAEYKAQPGLALVNAADAYARGATGAGIVVGVVDSGVQVNHVDLVGQIAPGGFDFALNTAVMTDPNGHGTHVAGLIAASKDGVVMHGLAYDAKVLPLKVGYIDSFGEIALGGDSVVANAWNHGVAQGARILNNSWGAQTSVPRAYLDPWQYATVVTLFTAQDIENSRPLMLQAARDAVSAGIVIVFAVGNTNLNI
jgi:subtilase-type serine protease